MSDPLRDPCELWDDDHEDDNDCPCGGCADMWERVDYDYDAYMDASLNLL